MSVWSDPRIIKISEKLIPTTDEVWRLQRAIDGDAIMFQNMAKDGHYKKEGGTRQGIYVCTSNGILLSSINSLNPDFVLDMIKDGLEKWSRLPSFDKKLSYDLSGKVNHRWEHSYPSKGLVLKSSKIDLLDDPPLRTSENKRWNIDYVWFSKKEAQLWIPDNIQIGQTYQLPNLIKNRLFQYHFLDNVIGQTLPFAISEIQTSDLKTKIIDFTDDFIFIEIEGYSKAKAKGNWLLGEDWIEWSDIRLDHGIETTILGSAKYNLRTKSFYNFEMVAIGNRYGKTKYNGRNKNTGNSYIGFLYTLAGNKPADKIAPAFIEYYDAEWVIRP